MSERNERRWRQHLLPGGGGYGGGDGHVADQEGQAERQERQAEDNLRTRPPLPCQPPNHPTPQDPPNLPPPRSLARSAPTPSPARSPFPPPPPSLPQTHDSDAFNSLSQHPKRAAAAAAALARWHEVRQGYRYMTTTSAMPLGSVAAQVAKLERGRDRVVWGLVCTRDGAWLHRGWRLRKLRGAQSDANRAPGGGAGGAGKGRRR